LTPQRLQTVATNGNIIGFDPLTDASDERRMSANKLSPAVRTNCASTLEDGQSGLGAQNVNGGHVGGWVPSSRRRPPEVSGREARLYGGASMLARPR
jgi:hypothetical protein